MTAAQLAHLAELSAYAADFFAITNPQAARGFGDTALRADALSARLRRENNRRGEVLAWPSDPWRWQMG